MMFKNYQTAANHGLAPRAAPAGIFCRLLFGLAPLLAAMPAPAVTVEFDYSYDTRGFFTDTATGEPILQRRAMLELAGSFYEGFMDALAPIAAGAGDTWSVTITHPSLAGPSVTLTDLAIPADTVRIYVGGSPSAPGVLGFAGAGTDLTASGSEAFVAAVTGRGQANATGPGATDYGVWGGYIWFNAAQDWYFDEDTTGLTAGRPDFLTTATHELGHILGFGTADSWFSQIDALGRFTGSASIAAYGGPVPLDVYLSHWAEGTLSDVGGLFQETLMDPSTVRGQRELMTRLDYAGFADIGWEVAPVPVPASLWLLASALAGFAGFRRAGEKLP